MDADDFYDYVDELKGVFVLGVVEGPQVRFLVDPNGMQSACYGRVGDQLYDLSHPQLVADLCGLRMDAFVAKLIEYTWYPRVMGGYLPVDLTPFAESKRVVANQDYAYASLDRTVRHHRFYPLKDLQGCRDDAEYQATIEAGVLERLNG